MQFLTITFVGTIQQTPFVVVDCLTCSIDTPSLNAAVAKAKMNVTLDD